MQNKIIKIIGYTVFAASILVVLLFFFKDFKFLGDKLAEIENFDQQTRIAETANLGINWGGFILTWPIILLIFCTVLVIGFALYKFIMDTVENPKSAIKPLLILGVVAVLVLIAFMMANSWMISTEYVDYAGGKLTGYGEFMKKILLHNGAEESNWVSMSRTMEATVIGIYFFFGLAIIALLYAEITKALK